MRIASLISACWLIMSASTLYGQAEPESLSFLQAVTRADEVSHELAALQSSHQASRQKIKSARAAYWPKLMLSGSYAHLSKVNEIIIDSPFAGQQKIQIAAENPYSSDLTLSWDVYTFGRRSATVSLTRTESEISVLDYSLGKKRLFDNVAKAYFAAVFTGQALELIRSEKQRVSQILKLAEDRFNQQLIPEFDLLQMRLRLDRYESEELQFNNNHLIARLNLARLLDISENDLPPLSDNFETPVLALGAAVDDTAFYRGREEFRQTQAGIETAAHARRAARSAYFPGISVFADYNLRNGYQPDLDKAEGSFSFGVNFNWLIFSGFARKAEISRLNYLEKSSQYLAEDLKLLLPYQAKSAMLVMLNDESRIEVGERSLAVAGKAMQIAQTRYNLGDISMIELLEAENLLSEAELGLLKLKYDHFLAQLSLKTALGYYPELELIN